VQALDDIRETVYYRMGDGFLIEAVRSDIHSAFRVSWHMTHVGRFVFANDVRTWHDATYVNSTPDPLEIPAQLGPINSELLAGLVCNKPSPTPLAKMQFNYQLTGFAYLMREQLDQLAPENEHELRVIRKMNELVNEVLQGKRHDH